MGSFQYIIISDEIAQEESYFCEELFQDEIVLIYDRYFASAPSSISLDEYLSLPHLIFSKSEAKTTLSRYFNVPDTRNIKAKVNSIRTAVTLLGDQYVITGASQFAVLYGLNTLELPFEVKGKGLNMFASNRLRHTAKSKC